MPAEQPKSFSRGAFIAVVGGAVAIAFAPIFIRWSEVGPIATAFWRLTLALPFLWTWSLLTERKGGPAETPAAGRTALLLMAPGLFFAFDQALWYWSVKLTTAANATLFVNFAPLFVAPVAWFWLRERLRWSFAPAVALALVGTWLVLGAGSRHSSGDWLALTAALFYAGYQLSVKRLRARHSVPLIMSRSSLACAVLLLAMALASGEKMWADTAGGWLVLLGLALICHVGGQGLITFAMAHLPASFGSVSLLVQPVAVAVFAWVILAERLAGWQIAGGLLVLTGIFLAGAGGGSGPAPAAQDEAAQATASSSRPG